MSFPALSINLFASIVHWRWISVKVTFIDILTEESVREKDWPLGSVFQMTPFPMQLTSRWPVYRLFLIP